MADPLPTDGTLKSVSEIVHELEGNATDLLPGVPAISDKEFAMAVDAVVNSKNIKIKGIELDGTADINPLDIGLLYSRIDNPGPLSTKMHAELIRLSDHVEKQNEAGFNASMEALGKASAEGLKLSALVKPEHLAALSGIANGPSTADGTSVSATGPNMGGARALG